MVSTMSAELYLLYTIVGLMVGIATLVGYVKRPWTAKAKEHRYQKKVLKLFMNGDPGVKGLIETIIPGPERVADAESAIIEHTQILKAQGKTLQAQGEVLAKVALGLNDLTSMVVELDRKITSNGGNTNNPGDVQMRQAKRTGDWLTEKELKTLNSSHE